MHIVTVVKYIVMTSTKLTELASELATTNNLLRTSGSCNRLNWGAGDAWSSAPQ